MIEGLRRLLWIYPSLRVAYRTVIQVRLVIGILKKEGSGIRFNLYPYTTKGTFADNTVILATHADPRKAAQQLQLHLNLTQDWLKKGE